MAVLVSPKIELGGATLAAAWQGALLEARAEHEEKEKKIYKKKEKK